MEGEDTFTKAFNISTGEGVMVFAAVNYSSDGAKSLLVDVNSEEFSKLHIENFRLSGVAVEDYSRTAKNYTTQVVTANVVNNWYSGDVNWSVVGVTNTTTLDSGQSVMVMVEKNYTEYGVQPVEVTAKRSVVEAKVAENIELRPLEIDTFQTLSDGTEAVLELNTVSNVGSSVFTWTVDTDEENISSVSVNITDDVMAFIQVNYSSGVHSPLAVVNTTVYNDSQRGVVVS
jgi:leucyl-tRNA synthetase